PAARPNTSLLAEALDGISALPLPERVRMTTGADSWRTAGSAALWLRPMVTSDGPSGVRGATLDERRPSSCLPCPSALGATWDPDLAAALGAEARAKGIDIVLAPTINLMRTPPGGRGFECFSEDPELTARIAVGYVRGLQSARVAAAVKHFVGNDTETGRWEYDSRIGAAALRELYLVPFEACVREAGTRAVMAAYNAVNGRGMTEHHALLTGVLKQEWGFAGPVISDWDATRSTVRTALAGLDLAMPGPNRYWGADLLRAVRDGAVPETVIDDKIARLVWLAEQVGALPGPTGPVRAPPRRGRWPIKTCCCAHAAVVIVGTAEAAESEGFDRQTPAPGPAGRWCRSMSPRRIGLRTGRSGCSARSPRWRPARVRCGR
ncbi:MAG: glycoside hydrolase family 3 protein, partial [Streptosporangiaceae bacterium]